MIEKLLQEQAEEAEHKGWCDVEMGKTKKALKSNTEKLEDLSTRIEKADSMSNKLSEQIELLAKELAELDATDKEATDMRQKEHAEFEVKKAGLEQALEATTTAIKVLKDYYAGKSFTQRDDSTSMSSLLQAGTEEGSDS